MAWRLRWSGTGMSSDAIASRVRQLIGMPSITCVPDVVTIRPGTCSRRMAPAITDRAAFPVQSVTTWRLGIPSTLPTSTARQNDWMPYTLVLLRHGQSAWNLENRFTGWIDVDLTDEGCARGTARRERSRRRRHRTRHRAHVGTGAGDPHRRARAARVRTLVDPGTPVVAVERAALRRAAGKEQGGNRGAVRRRPGEGLAPLLRRAARPARPPRRALRHRRSLRRPSRRAQAARRVLEGRARAHAAVVVRRDRARPAYRADRVGRRARQLAARARSSISTG